MKDEAALAEIARCSGTQFEPRIAEAFLGLTEFSTAA
jgi:response regulator RpfG family c-di-GMP phosphodiesterase